MRWIMIAGIVALAFVVAAVLAASVFGRFAEHSASLNTEMGVVFEALEPVGTAKDLARVVSWLPLESQL